MQRVGERVLSDALRVMLITDDRGDLVRLEEIITAALVGGIRAVQLRERALTVRSLGTLCERLRSQFERRGALLIVNDRADLVAAGLADGVHLGWRSLSPVQVRRFLPAPSLIGVSAHDAAELSGAADGGADYATLSPVFATDTHPGADPLGLPAATELTARARLPVLWLGGIDTERARSPAMSRPFGIAVSSAVCRARDVEQAARQFVSGR